MSDDNPERPVSNCVTNGNLNSLEAALLLKSRFKKSFDKLPLAVQRLAQSAFTLGENGPLLWDRYSSTGRLAQAQRWDFEHDTTNDALREKMWELQQAITRKLAQLDDEITLLETAPPTLAFDSDTRESKLVRTRLKRKTLNDDEAQYLAAASHELPSVVDRLMKAHPDLVTPSEPAVQSSEPATRQAAETGSIGAASPGTSRPAKFGIDSGAPGTPTEDTDAAPSRASMTELRKATPAKIYETISAIYDYASAQCMKPPNLRDIGKPVLRRLEIEGLTATFARIQDLAGDQRHDDRRRKQGHRLYGTLLPFSDTEI